MEYVTEIAQIHNLTSKQESKLRNYFFYLTSVPGHADVSKFVEILKKSERDYVLRFTKSDKLIFVLSNAPRDMNATRTPTEQELLDTVSMFFDVLKSYKGKISRETVSFYLNNYTGYGLNHPKLCSKSAEDIKEIRFSGAYKTFKSLPSDGFWFLNDLFKNKKLPSVEDMY